MKEIVDLRDDQNAADDELRRYIKTLEHQLEERNTELRRRAEVIQELRSIVEVLESSIAWTIVNKVVWPFTRWAIPQRIRRWQSFRLARTSFLVTFNRGIREAWYRSKMWVKRRRDESSRGQLKGESRWGAPGTCEKPVMSATLDMRRGVVARVEAHPETAAPVTIIICVFNALDDLTICVDSVIRHTNLDRHQLILVDDSSSEYGITDFLESVRDGRFGRVTVLTNAENMGYVKSCNRGLEATSEDVILLNSDTVVTSGWVEKLQEAAYSNPSIATVTPFTNHGVMCSIPEFGQFNEIPEGFSIDSFSALVEKISRREYPRIPAAVGFCCYIKRSVIDAIGLFDEENFGRGYGEEVDFTFRAVDAGYHNILDDATFVFHRGGASFGQQEKIVGEARATDQIWMMYPRLMADAQHFLQTNPLRPYQDRIKFFAAKSDDHHKTISVLQVGPYGFEASIGGSVLHTKDLVECLRRLPECQTQMIYPLFPDHNGNSGYFLDRYDPVSFDRLEIRFNRHTDRVFYSTPEHSVPMGEAARYNVPEPLEHAPTENMFLELVDLMGINVVHFQHFLGGFPVALLERCREAGIATVVTVHDYFLYCYNFTLFENPHKIFCDFCSDDVRCEKCLSHHWRVSRDWQTKRRQRVNELLPSVGRVVVPSEYLRERLLQLHPGIGDDQCIVIPHALSVDDCAAEPATHDGPRLRVAFVGFFGVEKGSRTFAQLVDDIGRDRRIEWHVFGEVRDWESMIFAQARAEVHIHGRYDRDQLPSLLGEQGIHVGVLLSGWPETYSYTLSELWLSRIPAIGFDIGALGDRLRREGGGGIAVPLEDGARGVASVLRGFLDDPTLLEAHRPAWRAPSIRQVSRQYLELYRELIADQ